MGCWRDVKSTSCSSGGPEFNSQQPHGGSQPSIIRSDDPHCGKRSISLELFSDLQIYIMVLEYHCQVNKCNKIYFLKKEYRQVDIAGNIFKTFNQANICLVISKE